MPHHQSTGLACKSRLTKSKDKELSAPASRLPASWYVNPRAEPCVGQVCQGTWGLTVSKRVSGV
eukprot:scaffold314477_cov17-Tisochrysis_lutea.AAC.1